MNAPSVPLSTPCPGAGRACVLWLLRPEPRSRARVQLMEEALIRTTNIHPRSHTALWVLLVVLGQYHCSCTMGSDDIRYLITHCTAVMSIKEPFNFKLHSTDHIICVCNELLPPSKHLNWGNCCSFLVMSCGMCSGGGCCDVLRLLLGRIILWQGGRHSRAWETWHFISYFSHLNIHKDYHVKSADAFTSSLSRVKSMSGQTAAACLRCRVVRIQIIVSPLTMILLSDGGMAPPAGLLPASVAFVVWVKPFLQKNICLPVLNDHWQALASLAGLGFS